MKGNRHGDFTRHLAFGLITFLHRTHFMKNHSITVSVPCFYSVRNNQKMSCCCVMNVIAHILKAHCDVIITYVASHSSPRLRCSWQRESSRLLILRFPQSLRPKHHPFPCLSSWNNHQDMDMVFISQYDTKHC